MIDKGKFAEPATGRQRELVWRLTGIGTYTDSPMTKGEAGRIITEAKNRRKHGQSNNHCRGQK
jgi:hypothetical protein